MIGYLYPPYDHGHPPSPLVSCPASPPPQFLPHFPSFVTNLPAHLSRSFKTGLSINRQISHLHSRRMTSVQLLQAVGSSQLDVTYRKLSRVVLEVIGSRTTCFSGGESGIHKYQVTPHLPQQKFRASLFICVVSAR